MQLKAFWEAGEEVNCSGAKLWMVAVGSRVISRCTYWFVYIDIEWPEGEEALSENARSTIDSLLNLDPSLRPTAVGVYFSYMLEIFIIDE
jgi:hypothetical protein